MENYAVCLEGNRSGKEDNKVEMVDLGFSCVLGGPGGSPGCITKGYRRRGE